MPTMDIGSSYYLKHTFQCKAITFTNIFLRGFDHNHNTLKNISNIIIKHTDTKKSFMQCIIIMYRLYYESAYEQTEHRRLASVIVGDRWGVYNYFNLLTCWLCSVVSIGYGYSLFHSIGITQVCQTDCTK